MDGRFGRAVAIRWQTILKLTYRECGTNPPTLEEIRTLRLATWIVASGGFSASVHLFSWYYLKNAWYKDI